MMKPTAVKALHRKPHLAETLKSALDLFQTGEPDRALALCEEILAHNPRYFDALHLLGVIHSKGARYQSGLDCLDRALRVRPDNAEALRNRQLAETLFARERLRTATALFQGGNLFLAEDIYLELLTRTPDNFDALQLLGIIAGQTQRPALAVQYLDRALMLRPDFAEAHNNRGIALYELKRLDEALASYERALALQPDHPEPYNNRAHVLIALRRLEDALDSCDLALALRPDYPEAHYNRGITLLDLRRLDEALASFDRALALKPDYREAHNNRGIVLIDLKRLDEGLASYDRALALKPDWAEALYNRGNALANMKRLEAALDSYDRAIDLKPDYAEALNNRGIVLNDLRRLDEALTSYGRALAFKPDYADANWNKALLQLLMGDFADGWRKYEWRWQLPEWSKWSRAYPQPLWLGNGDLRDKRILLWSEQGFGDVIQFCRFASEVAERGAVVILEAPLTLAPLLNSLAGIAEFVPKGSPVPAFDFHCPLLSLPLALNATLDSLSGRPYLRAEPAHVATWRTTLGPTTRPRVGLAWSGSPAHKNDHNRSIRLSQFGQALPEGIEYIQLQKEIRTDDQAWLAQHPEIRRFDSRIMDFGDTAALIESLDLIITVDTSIAHLAGAMGKEVWVLLPFLPDWRWLLDRTDSPWYDSATLFRQPAIGDWDSLLREVRDRLAGWLVRQAGDSSLQGSDAGTASATSRRGPREL